MINLINYIDPDEPDRSNDDEATSEGMGEDEHDEIQDDEATDFDIDESTG